MPSKRKPTTTPSSSTTAGPSKPRATPRSKLAKENNLTAEAEAEIREAFFLFAVDAPSSEQHQRLATGDIRRCLIALDTPPRDLAEQREIIATLDPEGEGYVSYEHFLAVAALKAQTRHHDGDDDGEEEDRRGREVREAYGLFTRGTMDREIGLADLRRVARELREEVPDEVLRDMIREATGGGLGGVGIEDFEGVMRRAGVFG